MSMDNSILAVAAATTLCELTTHPFEVFKIRSQVRLDATTTTNRPNYFQRFNNFVKQHGMKAMYKGLSAGLARAVQSQPLRLYTYETLNNHSFLPTPTNAFQQLTTKFCYALISSSVATVVVNPWTIVKVRMITDKSGQYGTLPKALMHMIRQDGVRELTKGTSINILRGVLLGSLDLTVYDTLKHILKVKMGHDQLACLTASVISSFTAAFFSYPLDMIITLHMNERSHGKAENRGIKHVFKIASEILKTNGVKGFYVGFAGFASRSMVYGPIFWNSLEIFNKIMKREVMLV